MIDRVMPYTDDWEDKADDLARAYAPHILPCVHCGYPHLQGYCCGYCGSSNPEGTKEERDEFFTWYAKEWKLNGNHNKETNE